MSAQEVAPAVKKEEANAKAERYHKLLLKRPDSEILFERFVGAWLDTGTKEGLQLFLKEAAEEGGAAEWQLLANYLGYGGEDEAALKALNAAVEKAPKDEALRVTRAKLQARLLNFEGALADLDAAGEKAKDGDDAALRGLYLARSGRPEEAVAAWKEVMKARPRDEELREDLIELEVAEGLYEEALETVDGLLAITKDPYLKALRRLRKGDVLVVSGKREDALKVFEEVLGSTGDNSWLEREVLAQVERVFVREDDVVGLRKFYDQLREAFPRRVSLRKGLAVQMAANGETEEAVKLFREVLKITPGDRRNREEFVDLLEAVEQMDEAVKELRALMGDKGDADLWERMAALQDKRSDEEGVKEALDKVLALKAEDPFGLIATARLFDNYKLDEEAEKILREGRAKFPETIEMTEALATFLAQAQREEEAVALWRELAKDADREGLMRVARSLSANGLRKEAFAMLDVRIEEFGRDPLLLAQYCELAAQTEQAKRAWPYAVALVRTAETSTGLEGALKVSMSMVRSLDQEALIQELKEAKTIGEQCLLSELYEFTGEDNVALEILDAAEKGDEGLMVAAQRVRLLERRGDLDKAADAMRALLARPKGRRPVHIRRLVSLLSAAGKMEAALVEVDGWKRLAPGDRVAWRTRSELLTEMGRIDEAVVELRRAASKFGAEDEEMRSRLAAALVEAGDYREGERIYKKLYEEAEDTGGKLRWIVEMVNLARQEGRQDELVEDFERRKRANPREVTPLLALAEIYNQLEDPLGQKEALAEAVRRRPGDVKLIGDLAKLAEKSGDLEAALKWREEATKRDPGPDSKRRLADYFFRSGEMESGLAQLKGIAAEAEDPRAIEKTLQALAKGGEWEVLLTYAKGLGPVMENDWRLSYIKAVALEEEGAEKEARAMFEAFVSEEKEIAGVKPLLPMKEFREWVQSNRKRGRLGNANVGETIAQYQWNQYQNLAYKHRQNRGSRIGYSSSGATADPVALPGEARELRWMAVGHLVGMSENKSEEERLEFLEKIHAPWLESIDLASYVQTNLVDYFGKKLEKNPEDLRTLARAVQRVGRNKEFGEKWLVLASEKLKEDWPMAAMEARFTLIQRSTEDVGEQASELLKLFENVDEQLESYALGRLAELAFGSSSAMKPEDKARVAGRIETYLTKVEDEFWMQNWWLVNYLKYRLSSGEYEKVVVVVNTIEAAAERERKKQGVLLKGSQRSSYRQPTLTMPTFSVSSLSAGIPSMLQQLFRNSNGRVAPKLTERQRELLKALQEGQKATPEAIDYVALSEHVGAIQNDYLRLMLLWQGGKKEEFSVELHKLAAQGDAGAVLMAAGYVTTQEKDLIKAYELLVKARTKPMERAMRTQMDSYIALIGSRLATQKETKGKVVVEEAKRAAMRLRRGFRDPAQVQQLAQVMGTLGMKEEMDRLLNPRSTRVRIGGASQYSSRSYRRRGAGIAKYLGLGNRKAAAMEAIKEARTYMSNQHSEYELREIVELIIGAQLGDEMLTLMNPGETKSVSRRLTYARMCSLLKKDEEALRVLRKLAEERPNDVAVQGQLAAVLPSDERQAAVRALLAKDALDEAGELIATMFRSLQKEEDMHGTMDLISEILENAEPSVEADRNLSFVPYHARYAFEGWSSNNISLPSLQQALKISEEDLESDNEEVQKRVKKRQKQWARRVEVANRLSEAMLRHPQTATQGFQLLHGHRLGLDREKEDFSELAKKVILLAASSKEVSHRKSGPWTYYRKNGNGSGGGVPNSLGLEPMAYLVRQTSEKKTGFDRELLKILREAEPEKEVLFDLLTALVDKDEEKALLAFEQWKKELPEAQNYSRYSEITRMGNYLLMLDLEDGKVMKALVELALEKGFASYSSSEAHKLYQSLGSWLNRKRGAAGVFDMMEQFTESLIGSRKNWPAYVELHRAGVLPNDLRQAESALESFFGAMVRSEFSSLETLIFVARAGILPVVEDLRYYFNQGLVKQLRSKSAEELVAKLEQVSLWKIESLDVWGGVFGEERSRESFYNMVAQAVQLEGENTSEAKKKVGELLKSAEGEGRFLKRLAGLHLAPGEDVKEAVIAELKREAKRLSELPETQMQGLGVVVRKWIPEMKIEGADKDTSALLVTLSKERKDGPIDLAKMWLENGFTDNRGNLRERVAYAAAELTKSDVKLANELWVAYLDHVRELAITGRGGTSSSGGFIIDPGDYAMNELFEGIVRKKVPAADWLQLLVALEGTEHGKTLGLGYNSYYSSQVVEQALSGLTSGQQMNEGNLYGVKKQWEAYPDLLGKDASAQVRGMAACYLATYYFERGNLRSPEKVLAWLEESKMLERRPIFGKVYRLIAISRIAQDGRSEAHKKEAIRLAAELFVNEEISARFRMMVAQWIASRSDHQWILNSEVSITAMVKLMDDYNNGRRAVVSTHMAGILGTLSKSDEGLSEEHAKHILKVFEPALFGPLAMRYYSGGRGREVFARPMMVMAIRAKDAPAAKRMAQIGGEAIKGDLALLLQLADHGEEELVRRLLAPPGALYIENAGGFDGELEKSWKNLREMVPEEKRFRIDCLLAGLSDSKEWKEGDGEKRADRLLALAKRFEKEAPAIRIARLQCMGAIANENAASEILEEHFAKETQRWMYGQGISQNRQPRELAAAQRIILQAMRMSGEKGEVALLKKQIMPLLDLAASDNYRSYQAMQLLGNMERAAIVSLLKGVGNNPDKVAEALPYTKEFLEKCLRSKRSHSGALVQLAVAQAVLVHALAGQGADYDKMVETFTPTMKTKYDEIRKAGIQNYLGMIGSRDSGRDWKHEDHAKVRVALLRALLMDEPTTKREFKNLNYVFRLAENGTFAYDDIAAAIKEMPSDRPEWKAFSGDLAMLLRLAELGEKEMIGKLLDSENGFYRTNALGSYNEKLQEKTEKLLALVEEDRRYRIEVLIAKCRNAKEYTEKHEGQDFKLRLKKLAEEFDKRAAESGPEVEQCLEAFADSEETLEILGGAYIKVAQGFDFPLGTGGNHQPTGREKAQQRIFRKAMLFEGINGSSERALKRMHSLIEIAKGEDKDAKKRALNGLHELSVSAARGYIFGMAANPDEKRLAEADQLLDELLALEGATKRSRQTAEVMAVIGYALCGKRAEFQKELESWPGEKKKAWHGARKDSWIKMFNLLNHHYYRSSYRTNERKVILKALLTDPETTTREIVHLSNLSSLMDGGVVQRDEIYEVVLALPEDHPRRAEFLTEVAGIKAWREEKLEEAMALYAQAEREAAARNDEATLSLTRAYHALCLAQVGQDPVAAWEFGSKVVIDDLPERDRAKFRKEIPKWKKAAVKAGKVAPEVKEEAPEKVEE